MPSSVTETDASSDSSASDWTARLESAVQAHDRATADRAIWLGAEPTFTDRHSEAREWISDALGEDKEARAQRLVQHLADAHPGAAVMRSLGRQYSGEPEPRWCYGLYWQRDGEPVWTGPPDRLVDMPTVRDSPLLAALRSALVTALIDAGWSAGAVDVRTEAPGALRVLCCRNGSLAPCDAAQDARLARPSIHVGVAPDTGVVDELATEGQQLVLLHGGEEAPGANACWIELPAFHKVPDLLGFLKALARAAESAGVRSLGLRGFCPPVDATVAWMTLTPDPAVLEINQAPEPDVGRFVRSSRLLFRLAAEVGLSPFRLQYNGAVSDSGGGGQLTFGGPSPEQSPFFETPLLLPRLIRYLIRHPALSYWFATRYVGGSSQSPRPDEGVRESFLELDVALERLNYLQTPTRELLWGTLRHFLADCSGNPHRSELNIEKLHNPHLPGRGCLGLVEFRALSMASSVEKASARALLLRGLIAMLVAEDRVSELWHWGDELHDRFALPFYLRRDLAEVFQDLRNRSLGLGADLEELLTQQEERVLARVPYEGAELSIEQALEFWPLVGDVASQEHGGSRLVDASTSRLEVCVRVDSASDARLEQVRVWANGQLVPLRVESTTSGTVGVMGLRFRSFVPNVGLHPDMAAEGTIVLTLHRRGMTHALSVTLHSWRPNGGAYQGLPRDLEDAARRRRERVEISRINAAQLPPEQAPGAAAVSPYCLDLRRLEPAGREVTLQAKTAR